MKLFKMIQEERRERLKAMGTTMMFHTEKNKNNNNTYRRCLLVKFKKQRKC